jgi:hypothetical protein
MKLEPLLHLVLGVWLGGSVILGAVVAYNFSGIDDLFARNPRLQERAGFAPDDADAKKSSLIWVHSSELNRVFFNVWNRTQLVLGGLAVLLAVWGRVGRTPIALLTIATAMIGLIHLVLEPQIVDLGRQLDFLPRDPPPPMLDAFQHAHGIYFAAESLRFGLLCLAALLLVVSAMRTSRDRGAERGDVSSRGRRINQRFP